MAEFQALKKPTEISLEDILLEKEKVESGAYPQNEVFEINWDDNTAGPFWQGDLQDFLQANPDFSPEAKVREYAKEEWSNLFEHPLFQRRKPKLISTQTLEATEAESFFLLREGQKWGPFNSHELHHMLKEKEIIVTDMVSIDKGHSWGRLYEIEEFDRRAESEEELPPSPEEEVFEHSSAEASQSLNVPAAGAEETEAIVGLAYIGQLKSGSVERTVKEVQESNPDLPVFQPKIHMAGQGQWHYKAMLVFSLLALSILYFNWPEDKTNPNKEVTDSNGPKVKKVRNVNRKTASSPKVKPSVKPFKAKRSPAVYKKPSPRRSAPSNTSFARSNSFKKARPKVEPKARGFKDNKDDDFYYDNGDDPVQQDPVRNKISKETLDPELEGEFAEGEEFRGVASENFPEEEFIEEGEFIEGEEELPLEEEFID